MCHPSDAVGSVFSSVASSYDMMNDAMSLGIHRLWKNHFVEMLNPRGGIQCLDVAGGTGDIALRLLDHARTQHLDRETRVTVLDINPQMLIEGQKRLKETMYWNTPQIKFQLGNAEALDKTMEVPERPNPPASTRKNPILPPLVSEPIASESMDLYTIAFGIRNCTHIDQVIREAYRPSSGQVDWAARVLEAAATSSGAFSLDGRMVDEVVLQQARIIQRRHAATAEQPTRQ